MKFLSLFFLFVSGIGFAQQKNWNDYYNENFNPFEKKDLFVALSLGFNSDKANNSQFLFQDVVNNSNSNSNIIISSGYFVAEYMAVGLGLSYSNSKLDLRYVSNSDTIRIQNASDKFIFTPFLRNYIPISKTKRFNLYNDTQLSFGFGNAINRKTSSPDVISKNYEDDFIVRLGIKPGVNVFIVKNFSFEVGIDLIGLQYERIKRIYDQDQIGTEHNFNFDFKIKLLSLDFGLAYYF